MLHNLLRRSMQNAFQLTLTASPKKSGLELTQVVLPHARVHRDAVLARVLVHKKNISLMPSFINVIQIRK